LFRGRSAEFADVCLDTVGASCGILTVLAVVLIIEKIKKAKSNKPKELLDKNQNTAKKRKVMFIASTGGHLNELMQVKPLFKNYDYHIVTEKTKVDESLKEKYQGRISFLIYGTKKYPIRYIVKFTANCFISLYYFFKYQPEVVVTTGTHTAVPMCYIAKIFGSKVIFIETFANRTTATVAGKLVYPIADTFVVQWEEMHKIYPKSVCWGWLY
jgi:UDP-N-acetylglucosamine:LPS N-acetylglucosamine transferase